MRQSKKVYGSLHKASAVFMMLALFWLTISTPFVCAFKQEISKQAKMENSHSTTTVPKDNSNPLGNNTEEKTPSSPTSFTEEYIHNQEPAHFFVSYTPNIYKYSNDHTYTAFHGELLVPPPNHA